MTASDFYVYEFLCDSRLQKALYLTKAALEVSIAKNNRYPQGLGTSR
ncbi:hypothetical protein VB620_17135 [Nodularia harveyana UHCC-0300]|uniref:HEPN domain-containing protein n=1 Tax=Nodularia harveyana UHCC-0300 TaxID=2974287 RepID=A0ABU5UHT0_9CYAN|nr:hypothetical protein [Nodularia harveyana]MEA5583060.1 hypothetical protein [Nodularia harveyana UHCC-0300]